MKDNYIMYINNEVFSLIQMNILISVKMQYFYCYYFLCRKFKRKYPSHFDDFRLSRNLKRHLSELMLLAVLELIEV